MRCVSCGSESPPGTKFCHCGARLRSRCPSCGAVTSPLWKFCSDCGAALGSAAVSPALAGAPLAADPESAGELELKVERERKMGTGPFTDVRDSTELERDLDPERAGPMTLRVFLSKFVGREAQLARMNYALELARRGHGQIVAAVGEAGVGKSRLFHEFKSTSQSGWMVLEAFPVSHGKTPAYLPVTDLLKKYFEITQDCDMGALRVKINRKVLALDRALEDNLSNLFSLLGSAEAEDPLGNLDAQVSKRRTLDAIKGILLGESLNQPLMLIFEDLHWIDEETQALLNLLADSIGNSKLLLLVSYRPEYSNQWGSKSYYTELRLGPLGREYAEELLSALVGVGADLIPLKRLIVERTRGNPFFIEETVQMLLDVGALVRNGSIKLTNKLNELKIPETVEKTLALRIQRLPLDEKELLQTMAAIGTEFAFSVLKRVVANPDDKLDRMLADLQMRRFIYERPATGDIEFAFKHALTQEAAYNSLPVEQRKLLHERIGSAVEASFAQTIDDHVSELAHHYGRSSNAKKAVEYLERAGRQAVRRGALKEAEIRFKHAIARLGSTNRTTERILREFELQGALAEVLASTNDPAKAEYIRATKRLQELGDKLGSLGQLMSASMRPQKPQTKFEAREESVPNHPPTQIPVLSWKLDPAEFESLPLRPLRDPNLAAFSAITVLVLVSLAIFYRDGLLDGVQSLLKTAFG
jgi:predicted ATPase